MKAVLCKKAGAPDGLILEEIGSPIAGPHEVVITVKACSVNYPDLLMVQGLYQYNAPYPFSPGGDIAGIVKEIGSEVKTFKPGDPVFGQVPFGGFAEEVVAAEKDIYPKPEGIDFRTAASVMMVYCSSFHALKDRAKLKTGENLVVLGASGGIGLAAIELGKILGARVIAAASTAEKLDLCRKSGADETINYTNEDLKTRIKELTDGEGSDVILDPVGGDYAEPALRSIKWGGRYLVTGFTAGIPQFPLNLILLKGCQVIGVFWKRFTEESPEKSRRNNEALFEMLKEGRLTPHIDRVYPLAEAPLALEALLNRCAKGKLVIEP